MSEGKGMSLVTLSPASEITFVGPFTDVVTSYLKISNSQSNTVCFKVKTTAPKQYCVRPNSGIIKPGETSTVAVMLQPMETIPSDAAKHKFMVQSCVAPSETPDLDAFWKSVNPSDLHYGKLRVVFEEGRSGTGTRASASIGGDSDGGTEAPSTLSHNRSSTAAPSSEGNRLKQLESEVERLQRERAELLLKVQAANSRAVQGGDLQLPTVQMVLIALAVLLLGLIVGKLF